MSKVTTSLKIDGSWYKIDIESFEPDDSLFRDSLRDIKIGDEVEIRGDFKGIFIVNYIGSYYFTINGKCHRYSLGNGKYDGDRFDLHYSRVVAVKPKDSKEWIISKQ